MIRAPDQRRHGLRAPGTRPSNRRSNRSWFSLALTATYASALGFATVDGARAQTLPIKPVPGRQEKTNPLDPSAQGPVDSENRADDVVVTARRSDIDLAPETELSEEDIGRYGANTIAELLHDVGPLIDGTGTPPIILVNGKRIGGASGIAGFPPEALARLAILAPAAAARYGYPADQRVVNLVLKAKFASWEGETGLVLATAGGRDGERMSANRVVIDGSTYWNAQVQLSRDSMLLRSARPLSSRPAPIDLQGHILGVGGQEIDPALSLIAGREVAIANFPPVALTRSPDLGDFAAATQGIRLSNPDDFNALIPGGRSLAVNVGVTHPLGSFTGSLNMNVNINSSMQLLGYPDVSLTLPAGNPWSPFGRDVLLVPDLAGIGPLKTEQHTKTLGLSASINGSIGGWSVNLLVNYTRSWSDSRFDRGFDLQDIQNRLDMLDPSFNPYAPPPRSVIAVDRSQSQIAATDAKLIVDRTLANLPAGPLIVNLSTGVSRMVISSTDEADAPTQTSPIELGRNQIDVRASLAIPLTRRGKGALAALGNLSANLAIGTSVMTGSKLQRQMDGSVTWSPAAALQFYGGYSFAEVAPGVDQLNGPRIETVIQIYDPLRQEVAEPIWITGGNPDLHRGTKTSLTLKGTWRPFGRRSLTLDVGYQRQVASGGITAFPLLTPAVEAAFPDRITRDASGRLVSVDARAINITRDVGEQLTTGFTWLWTPAARASPRAWQMSFTVNHSWQLESLLVIRPGLPALDRLGGDGGQPRHTLSLQLMAGRRGIGATLNGQWQNAVRINNASIPDGQGDFRYSALSQFNLNFFVEPGTLFQSGRTTKTWISNTRISIDLQNIFSSYQHVTLANGETPAGYGRYDLSPLGRTIQVTLRKRF